MATTLTLGDVRIVGGCGWCYGPAVGAPGYSEFAPDPRLADHVACIWSSNVPAGVDASHAVLPDGCIDLLFDAASGDLSVVGTMTKARWLQGCGPRRFMGVRFKPGGAVPFVRERANLLTDRLGDSHALFGQAAAVVTSRLVDASLDTAVPLAVLNEFLVDRVRKNARSVNRRITWATEKLASDPSAQVEGLAQELGFSRQYLRRLFLQETGVSPKLFARIMRLQRLAGGIASGRRLADLAFEAGYADQAHMTNEFRALVGATPTDYRGRVSIPSRPSWASGVGSAETPQGESECI